MTDGSTLEVRNLQVNNPLNVKWYNDTNNHLAIGPTDDGFARYPSQAACIASVALKLMYFGKGGSIRSLKDVFAEYSALSGVALETYFNEWAESETKIALVMGDDTPFYVTAAAALGGAESNSTFDAATIAGATDLYNTAINGENHDS